MIDVTQWPTGADLNGFNSSELTAFANNDVSEWTVKYGARNGAQFYAALEFTSAANGTHWADNAQSRFLRPNQRFTYMPGFGASDIHFAFDIYGVAWTDVGGYTQGNLQLDLSIEKLSNTNQTALNGNGIQPSLDVVLIDPASGDVVARMIGNEILTTGLNAGWPSPDTESWMYRGGLGTAVYHVGAVSSHSFLTTGTNQFQFRTGWSPATVFALPALIWAYRWYDPVSPYAIDHTPSAVPFAARYDAGRYVVPGIYAAPDQHEVAPRDDLSFFEFEAIDEGDKYFAPLASQRLDMHEGISSRIGRQVSYAHIGDALRFEERASVVDTYIDEYAVSMQDELILHEHDGDIDEGSLPVLQEVVHFGESFDVSVNDALLSQPSSSGFIPVVT